MITQCPSCKKTISVGGTGLQVCPKCGASIIIGDPLKDEENKFVAPPVRSNRPTESSEQHEKPVKPAKKRRISPSAVPWDRLKEIGFINAVVDTSRLVLFSPTVFFQSLKRSSDTRFIPLYGILMAIVGSLFRVFWVLHYFRAQFPTYDVFHTQLFRYKELAAQLTTMAGGEEGLQRIYHFLYAPDADMLVLNVTLTPIVSIITAAFSLFAAFLLTGGRARLNYFYRVAGFAQVTTLFNIIPFFGLFLASFWQLVLYFPALQVITPRSSSGKVGVAFLLYLIFSTFFTLISMG